MAEDTERNNLKEKYTIFRRFQLPWTPGRSKQARKIATHENIRWAPIISIGHSPSSEVSMSTECQSQHKPAENLNYDLLSSVYVD